jgi:hypothetical protein
MKPIISKEEVDKIMKINGEIRGIALLGVNEFIIKEEGKEGLNRLVEEMVKLGLPGKEEEIKAMKWYPIGTSAVRSLLYKRLFNWNDKKFEEIGRVQVKFSTVIRVFMKYFISLEKVSKQLPEIWRRYFTVGDAEVTELNRNKRYLIIRIKNFHLHPLECISMKGYIAGWVELIVADKVTAEETKCTFRGDDYHEFLLKW